MVYIRIYLIVIPAESIFFLKNDILFNNLYKTL